ncbi:hypothetical protein CEXT_100271 [Caerostris extrusa]|uniref:Uncharacterized protein n=1 Tax=Caerostris extrusa TaxID=172846 RepID=A0AAV4P643_CAEEX|nr:hypothetical protein CEXT_100271 [Caerostris extrusa]
MTKATACNLTFQAAVFNISPFQSFLSQYLEDTLCPPTPFSHTTGRGRRGVFDTFERVGIFEPSLNSLAGPPAPTGYEDAHRSCFGISCT